MEGILHPLRPAEAANEVVALQDAQYLIFLLVHQPRHLHSCCHASSCVVMGKQEKHAILAFHVPLLALPALLNPAQQLPFPYFFWGGAAVASSDTAIECFLGKNLGKAPPKGGSLTH